MKIAREILVAALIALLVWTMCAAIVSLTAYATSLDTALSVHSVVAPVLFALVSLAYFRRGAPAHAALTAAVFVLMGVAFALVTAATFPDRGLASLRSVTGTWLPLALVFVATWGIGLGVRVPSDRAAPRSEHVEDSS